MAGGEVRALGSDLFGDGVDLYTGRLSFKQVDIDIPGNSELEVKLSRSFSLVDPVVGGTFANISLPGNRDYAFGDWDLDVPRISATYAYYLQGNVLGPYGWDPNPQRNFTWPDQRCSGKRVPPIIGEFFAGQYWSGISVSVPNGGQLLQPAAGVQSPQVGGPYRWVTSGFTWISCLPSIKNGSGEGFLAITPDGVRYWFDWMAVYSDTTLEASFEYMVSTPGGGFEEVFEQSLSRRRHVLYVTRVEDRFGNWVKYDYANSADSPARLTKIESSDGRAILLSYNAAGRIASASVGARSWRYEYAENPYRLTGVVQPDGARWGFDLENVFREMRTDLTDPATCSFPGASSGWGAAVADTATLTMTHPSGAVGQFVTSPRLHGRSHVPKNCLGVPDGHGMPENGAYSDYIRMYWVNSLIQKRISGAGLSPMQWTYTYNNSQRMSDARSGRTAGYSAPGSWADLPYTWTRIPEEGLPVTDISTYIIADPKCVSDACAAKVSTDVVDPSGNLSRYTFGNSYRYNEALLLSVESGRPAASPLQVSRFNYQLAQAGQPYPAQIGVSRQYQGDAMNDAILRPESKISTQRDGRIFTRAVNSFDGFGRPLSITRSSAPVP